MGLFDSITGGSVLDFAGGLLGARSQNKANSAMAAKQMAFQERMSNTAHQREVKDLIAAGLNPILSAKLGGASSPSGASAQMVNEMQAGSEAASAGAARANLREQNKLLEDQRHNTQMDTAVKDKHRTLLHIQAQKADLERKLLELSLPGAQVEANIDNSAYGVVMRHAQRLPGVGAVIGSTVGGALGARSAVQHVGKARIGPGIDKGRPLDKIRREFRRGPDRRSYRSR